MGLLPGLERTGAFGSTIRALIRSWAPSVVGAGYLLWWVFSPATRYGEPLLMLVYLLFAGMIALSARAPLVSYLLLLGVPILQLGWVLPPTTGSTWPMYLAACAVAFFAGLRENKWIRYLALPVGAASSALIAYLVVARGAWAIISTANGTVTQLPPWLEFLGLAVAAFLAYSAAWSIGVAIASLRVGRVLKAAETQLEEKDFELRLTLDRARISRDLHDALAHSLTVVVSQAEGALALQRAKPAVAEESLHNIATVGRAALVEVRRLVERINDDDPILSGNAVDDLETVADDLRSIGMDITIEVLGEPTSLAPAQDIAVFRIVQESLTNALKHAGPSSTVHVSLDWRDPGLAIVVTSSGDHPLIVDQGSGRGVGIAGMKERARLVGGWVTTSRKSATVFVLAAFIPVQPSLALSTADQAQGAQEAAV